MNPLDTLAAACPAKGIEWHNFIILAIIFFNLTCLFLWFFFKWRGKPMIGE